MVFKPWTEQRAPRHLLEDNDEDFSTPLQLPTITTDDSDALSALQGALLVIPDSLNFLPETLNRCLRKSKTVAELVIKKKFTKRNDPDEFIEEEQLYSTTTTDDHEELISSTCVVKQYTPELSLCVVKNYDNIDKINYTLIATELLKHVTTTIVTITPGTLPFDQLICTLGPPWGNTNYEPLSPPFVITGIAGALVSQAELLQKDVHALVLQSEGVPGFEKVSEYSVQELGSVLKTNFELGEKFGKTLDVVLHSGKSVNNLGLYL